MNWATFDLGAKVIDVSSEIETCNASNVLDPHLPSIWLTEDGLPQWLCISLANVTLQKDKVIRTIGWHCWQVTYIALPISPLSLLSIYLLCIYLFSSLCILYLYICFHYTCLFYSCYIWYIYVLSISAFTIYAFSISALSIYMFCLYLISLCMPFL